MKKLILYFFIFFSLTTSAQSWTYIDASKSGVKYYIDFNTIKTLGDNIYYWELASSPKFLGKNIKWKSRISHKRLNCSLLDSQELLDFFYQNETGEGKPLYEIMTPSDDWDKLKLNSIGEYVAIRACEGK